MSHTQRGKRARDKKGRYSKSLLGQCPPDDAQQILSYGFYYLLSLSYFIATNKGR